MERRTAIKIGYQKNYYKSGEGVVSELFFFSVPVGTDDNGELQTTDIFYCEWRGAFGSLALSQESQGAKETARIRLPYVKSLLDVLHKKNVRIFKNAIIDEYNCFELSTSANNVDERNQIIEFMVKRHEEK